MVSENACSTRLGDRAYYWVHCDARFAHFQFDTSRSGQVSRDVLGEHFTGTLVTDCYAGYEAQQTAEKIWLRERLQQLMAFPVTHEKAVTLQKRIAKHQHEWLMFLDDPRVPPTNNMAERPPVIPPCVAILRRVLSPRLIAE